MSGIWPSRDWMGQIPPSVAEAVKLSRRHTEPVYLYSLFYFSMFLVLASLANLHTHAFPIQGTFYFKS